VNVSSGRVLEGTPNRLHYTTAKAGVIGFTRALARELGPDNINVNVVLPGLTLSDTQVASSQPGYISDGYNRLRALQRAQYPEDLVGTVLYLLSGASDFVTGQSFNVDGGKVMH
jgi:3-oxoacyl-[acyl-carrier protein] reductase